jgi:hypothetical protein
MQEGRGRALTPGRDLHPGAWDASAATASRLRASRIACRGAAAGSFTHGEYVSAVAGGNPALIGLAI